MKNIKTLAELLVSVRKIDGFPLGKDEDILNLSDPPYYTACPNPYINDFIKEFGTPYDEENDDYHREPFASDVSEGKGGSIYNAHTYHTKVPHKAIMKYIEHYTEKGNIVFDGFCGTGMTGIAAQLLNRKAIISDISPLATFISYNYNKSVDANKWKHLAQTLISEVENECSWMYETLHPLSDSKTIKHQDIPEEFYQTRIFDKSTVQGKVKFNNKSFIKGKINFIVWAEILICPYCGTEINLWDATVDHKNKNVAKQFNCLNCKAQLEKKDCTNATHIFFDNYINQEVVQVKVVPVLINYSYKQNEKNKRAEKKPDAYDLALIKKIEESDIPYWFPIDRMPEGDEARRNDNSGITHVHHFFTKRNLWILSAFWAKSNDSVIKSGILSNLPRGSKRNRYMPQYGNKHVGILSGTLYIPFFNEDNNIFNLMNNRINAIYRAYNEYSTNQKNVSISTTSLTKTNIPSNSIDYIFTDPPFGDNLMYSALNFISESWLKVKTQEQTEAIINKSQNKGISEYSELMHGSFRECYRILKPNHWITVEFHNSKSAVWNAIQEGLSKAGFIIAQVTILDKQKGTTKQLSCANATKNDLVISAYKPKKQFEERFLQVVGKDHEIAFVKMHLEHQPKQPSIERTEKMLYSKMLAYYVQRGYEILMDSKQFYRMLRDNFIEEDSFWFNSDQVTAYHTFKKKMKLEGLDKEFGGLIMMFIIDEKSAIIWLHQYLIEPQDYSTIHTDFTKILQKSEHDQMPELQVILKANFINIGGKYRLPQDEDEKHSLTDKREKELMREFEEILLETKATKKKIKSLRKEALSHGFRVCYQNSRFKDILAVAKKLDNSILENDSELREFAEIAEIKIEGLV